MRYSATPLPFPLASATSHSSRSHGQAWSLAALPCSAFSAHQSPEERHGPADHKIFPCSAPRSFWIGKELTLTGRPSATRTQSCHGGRNIRNANGGGCSSISDVVGCSACFVSSCVAAKRSIRKLSCR